MVGFSWNSWVVALRQIGRNPTRRPRAIKMARVEGLEDRALLTANLPVAVNDTYQVTADTTLNSPTSVLDNDTDIDGDTIDQVALNSNVSHGTLSLATDGTFAYTPDTGFSGVDSFTYFARDSADSENSASPATVTLNVGSSNHAPVARPITINVAADTPFSGGLTGTDSDNDSLTFSAGSTQASHGAATINSDGSFTYSPGSGYIGPDSFSFKVNDGTTNSADALVTVNVGSGADHAPTATSISINVATDTQFAGALSGNDVDGVPLTFSQGHTLAAHGTVSISQNGNFTYTPNVGYTGADSFSFAASDGTFSSTNDGIVSVQVANPTGGNTAPVANAISIHVGLNTTFVGGLSGSDADGDPLTFSTGSIAAQHGSLGINSNGTFNYTPNTGYVGSDSFSFKVNDGTINSADALVSVTVGGTTNHPPVAAPVTINDVPMNTSFSGTLQGSDSDGDALTFSAGSTAPAHGTVQISANGAFNYTPNNGFTGTDSFSFKVNDGTVNSADALVTLHISGSGSQNTPPVATAVNINVGLNTTFIGGLSGTDADGDPLTFSAGSTAAAHGTLNINANGSFTYTPNNNYTGSDAFSFKVNDGTVNSADALVSIQVGTASNTPPVANPVSIGVAFNTTFIGSLTGSDVDGDPLTFSAGSTAAAHGTLNINANGTFSYTPNNGYSGSDSFSFKVNDGTTNSADALVSVQVGTSSNTPPVANPISITVAMNTTFTGGLSGSDADGDPLTFLAGTITASHGAVHINTNGSFTYTPNTGYVGSDTFSFKVNDGTVNSSNGIVSVQIIATGNSPPVATPVSISVGMNTTFSGFLSGTDADGDPLTFAAGNTHPAHGTVNIASNGSFTYTPNANFTGSDSFSFRVNDGTINSADALVSIQVGTAANTPPTANSTSISVGLNTLFAGTLSGSDVDGDPLTFSAGSTSAAHGSVIISSDGSFFYNPAPGYTGSDIFSFKVNDGTANSADGFVFVSVGSGTNTPPVANSANIGVALNTTFHGTLTAFDADQDILVFSAGGIAAIHGTVIINANGSFTYTPDTGFTGSDEFSFKVNDGTVDSADALISVTVGTASNTPPVAHPATVSTPKDVALSGSLIGTDVDGDPLTFSAGATAPMHGSVTVNSNGTFTYIPDAGFVGFDLFTFKVNDGTVDSPAGNVIVHVIGTPNGAPTVSNGSGNVATNVTFDGSVSPLAVDHEGDPLTFSVVTPPTHGSLTLNPDGTFAYTPDTDFVGSDFFTFKANDGSFDSNVATFNLNVSDVAGGFTLILSDNPGTIATSRSVVPLDGSASLINVAPTVNFANAAVTARITSGASSQDRFVLTDGGSVDIRGRKIRVNGTEVARISGGRGGQALEIAFNSSATTDSVQAVIQRIGLRTTRRSGSDPRVVQITVNADGFSSSASIVANKV
ncbi:MAG: outer rane adhesin like protein [Planctomycetaceae bacterium]|nr:outer rane adhesin like protein [Planctomycetaceae bacterium]